MCVYYNQHECINWVPKGEETLKLDQFIQFKKRKNDYSSNYIIELIIFIFFQRKFYTDQLMYDID